MVAYDAVGPAGGAGQFTNSTNLITWTHTVGAGGNVIAIAAQCDVAAGGYSMAATCPGGTVSSLGLISATGQTSSPTVSFVQMWLVTGVSAGAYTVTVTTSGGTPTNTGGGSVSVSGCTGNGTAATAYNASTGTNVGVPATTTGNLVIACVGAGGTITAASSPSTGRVLNNGAGSGGDLMGNIAIATWPSTGGTVTTNWSLAVSCGLIGVELTGGTNTSPAWAASYDTTAVAGTGTWTNPANAEGTGGSSGPWATWTAP